MGNIIWMGNQVGNNEQTLQTEATSVGSASSNMYRRDTKTKWTQQQLLKYQLELSKELQRQTNLEKNKGNGSNNTVNVQQKPINSSNMNNNTNIFTCCMSSTK